MQPNADTSSEFPSVISDETMEPSPYQAALFHLRQGLHALAGLSPGKDPEKRKAHEELMLLQRQVLQLLHVHFAPEREAAARRFGDVLRQLAMGYSGRRLFILPALLLLAAAAWSAFWFYAASQVGVRADAWRAQYQPAMEDVRSGRIPFSKLDVLHRRNLDVVLKAFGLDHVDEATRVQLNFAWHRLDAWPDVTPGLARLRLKYRLAPCSNGNISLMADLARRHGWHWDAITGAELRRVQRYRGIVIALTVVQFRFVEKKVTY